MGVCWTNRPCPTSVCRTPVSHASYVLSQYILVVFLYLYQSLRVSSASCQQHPASPSSPHHSTVCILAPSACRHLTIISPFPCHCHLVVSLFHHHTVTPVSVVHISLSLSSIISSQSYCLLHYSFILWFHFYLLTPIYLYLYLYTPLS